MLRHGGTREQLLGVEAVLGTGHVVRHLGGLEKDNTGYHLPSLLCGSEGTLGIVTAARLRLIARHAHRVVALVGFADVDAAVAAVAAWRDALDALEAAELFLDAGLRLVCDAFDLAPPFARPGRCTCWWRWPATATTPTSWPRPWRARPRGDVAVATDAARQQALWRYREDHTLAMNTLGPPHKLDVTVPHGRAGPVPRRAAGAGGRGATRGARRGCSATWATATST